MVILARLLRLVFKIIPGQSKRSDLNRLLPSPHSHYQTITNTIFLEIRTGGAFEPVDTL